MSAGVAGGESPVVTGEARGGVIGGTGGGVARGVDRGITGGGDCRRDRRGERRSCERGREQALLDEGSTVAPSGNAALDPSGNTSSRPSDNSSSRLSRNCWALPSGHTSTHPLRPRQPWPPPVIPVLAPPVIPAIFLRSRLLPRVVFRRSPPDACRRPLR